METKCEQSTSERLLEAYRLFLLAVFQGKIEYVAHAAYQIFNRPVDILDNAGRVIYLIPNHPIGYPLWDEWVEKGTTPLKRNLDSLKYYDSLVKDGKYAVYIDGGKQDGTIGKGLMIRFFENGICAGHCGVHTGDYVPDEIDMQIAELFGMTLTHLYSHSFNKNSSGIYHSAFLKDMLLGRMSNSERTIADYNLKLSLKKSFVILTCQLPEDYQGSNVAYSICDNLSRRFQDTISTICDNYLVILCCQMDETQRNVNNAFGRISKITDYLAGYNILVGISALFNDTADIKVYYEQARTTLQTGLSLNLKSPFAYENVIPYQLIRTDIFSMSMIHPILSKIEQYDKNNHTEYLQTYRIYMLCGKDKKYAAEKLHIHVNTLSYRLNILNDLFKIFEMSKQEELHINLSFLYIDLTGKQNCRTNWDPLTTP